MRWRGPFDDIPTDEFSPVINTVLMELAAQNPPTVEGYQLIAEVELEDDKPGRYNLVARVFPEELPEVTYAKNKESFERRNPGREYAGG